jgi:hypothetical protein
LSYSSGRVHPLPTGYCSLNPIIPVNKSITWAGRSKIAVDGLPPFRCAGGTTEFRRPYGTGGPFAANPAMNCWAIFKRPAGTESVGQRAPIFNVESRPEKGQVFAGSAGILAAGWEGRAFTDAVPHDLREAVNTRRGNTGGPNGPRSSSVKYDVQTTIEEIFRDCLSSSEFGMNACIPPALNESVRRWALLIHVLHTLELLNASPE